MKHLFCLLILSGSAWISVAAAPIEATAPGALFTEWEALKFQGDLVRETPYTVRDAFGETVLQGTFGPGENTLPPLVCGYYRLELPDAAPVWFGVVPPRVELPAGKSSAYAMDSAFSMFARHDPGQAEVMAEVLSRIGVAVTRDRNYWIQPGPDDFQLYGRPELRQHLTDRGIAIAGMIHDPPAWVRTPRVPIGKSGEDAYRKKLPDDLRDIYRYCRFLAERLKGTWQFAEFWNEPELGPDGCWEYAAASKAAFLGFRAGDPALTVFSGSFCAGHDFLEGVLANGGGEYFDVLNCHLYENLDTYPRQVNGRRALLERFGYADRAIVYTENSLDCEGDGQAESGVPGIKAHSPAQELLQAEFTVKSQLLMQFLGVWMDFSFVLAPYNERHNRKDWGFLRRGYTTKAVLPAFAALTHELAAQEMLGEYNPTPGTQGYLFAAADGTQTLAVWKKSELEPGHTTGERQTVTLPQPRGAYPTREFFGKTGQLEARNGKLTLELTRYPLYLKGLRGLKPQRASHPAGPSCADDSAYNREVVLRLIPGDGFEVDPSLLSAVMTRPSGVLILEVYNFSATPQTGAIQAHYPGVVAGWLDTVTVPPGNKLEFSISCIPAQYGAELWSQLRFGGKFNGREITPAVITVQTPLSDPITKPLPGSDRVERYRPNASGQMTAAALAEEDAVHFTVEFSGSTRWIYPEFIVTDRELLADAVGLSFEIRLDPETAAAGASDSVVFFCLDAERERANAVVRKYDPPQHAEWQTVTVYPPAGVLAKTAMLRIGLNPRTARAGYSLRNIRLVYQ